jgi:hypothetical protein
MSKVLITALVLLLVNNTFQQVPDIITYFDNATASARVVQEAQRIVTNLNWSQYLKSSDVWEYIDIGTFFNGNIRLQNFKPKNFTFDFSTVNVTIGQNAITVTGADQIFVSFNFNYNAKTGAFSSTQGTGIITVIISL